MVQKMEFSYNENELSAILKEYIEEYHMEQSRSALPFAVEKHRGQKRKEGIPYIIHPLTMACHCLTVGILEDEIIAAVLLHDVCEDCPVKLEELPVAESVRRTVDRLTYYRNPGETKQSALGRYYLRMRDTPSACIIKLFDRCHNISSMSQAFTKGKLVSYIKETREYVYPLAEYVKQNYLEFRPAVFLLEYQMKSIIAAVER